MNKICSNCVLDTTISNINFNDNGICDFCQNYYKKRISSTYKNNEYKLTNLVKNKK